MSQDPKVRALRTYLGLPTDAPVDDEGDGFYVAGSQRWAVLTDDEAAAAAHAAVIDLAWAFNTSFLEAHALPGAESAVRALESYRHSACESANDATLALIADRDRFVREAIEADGRGHFLNTYDGEERHVDGFYLYRLD